MCIRDRWYAIDHGPDALFPGHQPPLRPWGDLVNGLPAVSYTHLDVYKRQELALILVDARHGIVEQTRRHLAVTGLLGVRHVALAVNKMELAGWDELTFAGIRDEFQRLATGFGVQEVTAIPLSALTGDNVVDRSAHTPWYAGPTLLEHLETVPVGTDVTTEPVRLPVQGVIRPRTAPHPDYRGYAGRLASGCLLYTSRCV